MKDNIFAGEYWCVGEVQNCITRLQFLERADQLYVAAWGSCFPEDCEWGETELHVLSNQTEPEKTLHAFATWIFEDEDDKNHCLFEVDQHELKVTYISIRSEIPSYFTPLVFRKDAVRSAEAQNADPLMRFKHMWDGSEAGWRLIQYSHPVFFVALNFEETGPDQALIPTIMEFSRSFPNASAEEVWEKLRGCSGMGLGGPLGPEEMNRLLLYQSGMNLNLTICTIEPDDHLVLSPDGNHFDWVILHSYRLPVIQRMIEAGVPVVSGHLD